MNGRRTARLALTLLLLVAPWTSAAAAGPNDPDQPDERSLAYRYDEQLGWFPRAGDELTYTGSRKIHIAHNDRGFRDIDHATEKTRPRLIFLGDSFVWGYDVEREERFTDRLQRRAPQIEIFNMGVSGYGTDQCFLLLQKVFAEVRPDAVIYMFSATDIDDNAVNFNYRAYYKPYFVLVDGELALRGVPVPRSSIWDRWLRNVTDRFPRLTNRKDVTPAILTAMNGFVKSRGASFAVGLIDDDEAVREHLNREGIVYFDLTHVDARYRYPSHGFHWTPEGHELVARAVEAFLLENSKP